MRDKVWSLEFGVWGCSSMSFSLSIVMVVVDSHPRRRIWSLALAQFEIIVHVEWAQEKYFSRSDPIAIG